MHNESQSTKGPPQFRSDPRPAGRGLNFDWLTEAFILKTVFRLLILGALTFLAIDFRQIYEEANVPLPGQTEQDEPVIMEPPRRQDQLRPYLPLTNPLRQLTDNPEMPGYAKPPTQDQVAGRMIFTRGPNGAASAVGRIEQGSAADFSQFIEGQGGEIKSLHLHSPGGSVQDALEMSALLREKGIETVVPQHGYCASSCPIVFSGGAKRSATEQSWIGVHQIYAAAASPGDLNQGLAHGQTISAEVQDHLIKMGVDTQVWIHAMRTPSDQLYIFTPQELTDLKLATEVTGT